MILTPTKILVILAVIAVFFGYRKLPDMGKSLGEALRNFRKSVVEPDTIDITPDAAKEDEQEEQAPELKAGNKGPKSAGRPKPNRTAATRRR